MCLNHPINIDVRGIDLTKLNKKNVHKSLVEFTEMDSYMKNSIQLFNPAFNDIEDPTKNLKDVNFFYTGSSSEE
jgi:hypothetical protein